MSHFFVQQIVGIFATVSRWHCPVWKNGSKSTRFQINANYCGRVLINSNNSNNNNNNNNNSIKKCVLQMHSRM